MKRNILSITLTVMLIFTLTACGGSGSPETTVGAFCDALKTFDVKGMMTQVDGADASNADISSLLAGEGDFPESLAAYFKENAAQMTYTIDSTTVDGDSATATVSFKYVDASPVIQAVFTEVLSEGFKLAMEGKEMSEEDMNALFDTSLETQKGTVEPTFAESTVEIELVKSSDGWKLTEINDDLMNIITSNFMSATSGLTSSIGN